MSIKWIKKGLIFKPDGKFEWMKSHASLPFVDRIKGNVFRIYFSSRDSKNRSSVGYLEIDVLNPSKILFRTSRPVLSPGKIGTFDESGVMGSSLVSHDNKKYLYYTGWTLGKTMPYNWSIGLAISYDDGKTFQKYSDGPIFTKNPSDPYFVASPTVIFEKGVWKMWYISTNGWLHRKGRLIAPYYIKYAESKDGISWNPKDGICIKLKPKEIGVGRASIVRANKIYKMWYSYSCGDYRIGYAESKNGVDWKRKDNLVGIDVSSKGWDSKSIEYPHVFENNKRKIMLYNGNDFGKTGFGYALSLNYL